MANLLGLAELRQVVLEVIAQKGPIQFRPLMADVTSKWKLEQVHERLLDRALQRLRKNGNISYDRARGWWTSAKRPQPA